MNNLIQGVLLFVVSAAAVAGDFSIGIGSGWYDTQGGFRPGGERYEVTYQDSDEQTKTLRLGYRADVFEWLAAEVAVVHFGVLREAFRARLVNGRACPCILFGPGGTDERRTETSTYGLELTLQPQWGAVYLRGGAMYYLARHHMDGTLGDDARTVGETTGVLGAGVKLGRWWRVEYTTYNHLYTRNSDDASGRYAREEYRNFHHVQIVRALTP